MTIEIQVSLGNGSLGMMWRAVTQDELQGFVAKAAATNNITEEVVEAKLSEGRTIWLDHATERKLRGHDAQAASLRAAQRDAQRKQRADADGYFNDY
jgi:hypothetical protein